MNDINLSSSDVLEMDQINGLVDAAGVEGTQEILAAFWQSTETLLAALEDQVSAHDADMAARTAHAIKGSAANVGATRLAKIACLIEECCKTADAEGAVKYLGKVAEAYAETRAAFDAHLAAA